MLRYGSNLLAVSASDFTASGRRVLGWTAILLLAALFALAAAAAPASAIPAGSLDPTFDNDGKLSTPVGGGVSAAYASLVLPDGKYVVVGETREAPTKFAMVRYLPSGALDETFGSGGRVVTAIAGASEARAFSIARDSSGRLVLAGKANLGGQVHFAVARYSANGAADNAFSDDGQVSTLAGDGQECGGGNFGAGGRAVDVQSDGKVVVGGCARSGADSRFALVRYASNGTLDAGPVLDDVGNAYGHITGLDVRSDNSIAVGGFAETTTDAFVFARYTATLTRSGADYSVIGTGSRALGMTRQSDGRYVLVGNANSPANFALARFNANGGLDGSFGDGGTAQTTFTQGASFGGGVAVQPDGKIVAAGSTSGGFAIARYSAAGQPDGSFGSVGRVFVSVGSGAPTTPLPMGVAPTSDRVAIFGSPHAATGGAPDAFAGVRLRGYVIPDDGDRDGVPDERDNCRTVPNANQADRDRDGIGDACDSDNDNDGRPDNADNCPALANPSQLDSDRDGPGDVCDPDDDNDGVPDTRDNCYLTRNSDQADTDRDRQGDACDADDDNDRVPDAVDGPGGKCSKIPAPLTGGCPVMLDMNHVRAGSARSSDSYTGRRRHYKVGKWYLEPKKGAPPVKDARVRVRCIQKCRFKTKTYRVTSNKRRVVLRVLSGQVFKPGARFEVTLTRAEPLAQGKKWDFWFERVGRGRNARTNYRSRKTDLPLPR